MVQITSRRRRLSPRPLSALGPALIFRATVLTALTISGYAAAAQVAREIIPDLFVVGVVMLLQQGFRHQDEARRTVAALKGTACDEGILNRVELAAFGEVLDRHHLGALRKAAR